MSSLIRARRMRRLRRVGRDERGAEVLEFALVFPLFAFLVFALMFSLLAVGAWVSLTHGALQGVRYASIPTDLLNGTYPTNAQVATVFQTKFMAKGPKLEAQVMATALAVYVTDQSLAGTAATAYGFKVTTDGAGVCTVSVGSDGAAVGKANNTVMSVMDILLAVDDLWTVQGYMYGTNTTLQNQAADLFGAINAKGGI